MPGTPDGLPRLYTPAEVAEALRCSTWWVQEQARRRRFPHCQVAGSCRFTAEHYAVILRLTEVLPNAEIPSIQPEATPVRLADAERGGLKARVPRRLRKVPAIDTAA